MEEMMKQAITVAEKGKTPFGAALVLGDEIIHTAHNTVAATGDKTQHAEMLLLQEAVHNLPGNAWARATLYTTGEPCPMCMAAIVFAGIGQVIYGAPIPLISQYLPQIHIRAEEVIAKSPHKPVLKGPVLERSCEELLKKFS